MVNPAPRTFDPEHADFDGLTVARIAKYKEAESEQDGGSAPLRLQAGAALQELAEDQPRNHYVLSQFHPASYLWLEDLVRSLAADYWQRRAPPVLRSREFKYGRLGRSGWGGLAGAGLYTCLSNVWQFFSPYRVH